MKYNTRLEALADMLYVISVLLNKRLSRIDCLVMSLIILLPDKHRYNPLSTQAKKFIASFFNISQHNLNNRVYDLQKAEFLVRDEEQCFQPHPNLLRLRDEKLTLNVSFTSGQDTLPDHPFNIPKAKYTTG